MSEGNIHNSGHATVNVNQSGLVNRVLFVESDREARREVARVLNSMHDNGERIQFLENYFGVSLRNESLTDAPIFGPYQYPWPWTSGDSLKTGSPTD